MMHHRLDHQCGFQRCSHAKQIVGAIVIVLGDPDPRRVLGTHVASLDQVALQHDVNIARLHTPPRVIGYDY